MNLIPVAFAASQEAEKVPLIPDALMKIILGVAAFAATYFLATFFRNWVQRIIRNRQGDQHEEVCILYGRIIFTTTFVVGTMIALTVMGAPLEWFTGGIGLGLAFSLRSFLANFFAGIVLLSNSKFNLGDFVILSPDISGTIVDIQSRATSLRGVDGGEVTIPNLKVLESAVKCFTKNPIRRHAIEIGVGYGSNIREACELLQKVISANKNAQPEPSPVVLVKEVADSAVILEARFWTESATKWWKIKSDITRDIFNALNEAKIDIPYPVQTLRVDEFSSDILAKNPLLLKNLENIEKSKHEEVFKQTPNEAPAPANS
ncbi:mechanosensitive ion channel family protein [Patescibacteria group bacterium]|nr:mechanosensitive ion channel family protein [Patescibacteria group bacterium]